MDGVVVIAGVFTPGSVVRLFAVADGTVLRVEGNDVVAMRIVDSVGNVGFDGLEIGGRYFAEGYIGGNYTLVRARAVDAGAPDSELQQAPIQATPQPVGTQEEVVADPLPAVPQESLETGIPAAAESVSPIVSRPPEETLMPPPSDGIASLSLSPDLVAQASQLGVQFADRFASNDGLRDAIARLDGTPVA
jgi:hypothetical protein